MICQHCKSYKATEKHHIIPRSAFGKKVNGTRESPMNKINLCHSCHHKHHSLTNLTKWFCDAMYKEHGNKFWDYMMKNRHRNKKVSEWLTERGY